MTRWKLTVEYDGGPFSGWQRQEEGIPSVQQAIEDAIFAFCQQRLTIHVAGRTDAGVHARGQVCHVDIDYGTRALSGFDLAKALNAHLRPLPVAILSAQEVDENFHARFSATNKLYNYLILNRNAPPALEESRVWYFKHDLDVPAMNAAAKLLLGHHDFTTFRDSQCQAKTPMRTLDRLEIEEQPLGGANGRLLTMHAEGRSFLHHQVRNMIGTLTLVGQGRWTLDDFKTAFEAKDRTRGGQTAPPQGLYMMRIDY